MPIQFRCQDCDWALSIAARKVGEEIECPKCQAVQTVPPESDSLLLERRLERKQKKANELAVIAKNASHSGPILLSLPYDPPGDDESNTAKVGASTPAVSQKRQQATLRWLIPAGVGVVVLLVFGLLAIPWDAGPHHKSPQRQYPLRIAKKKPNSREQISDAKQAADAARKAKPSIQAAKGDKGKSAAVRPSMRLPSPTGEPSPPLPNERSAEELRQDLLLAPELSLFLNEKERRNIINAVKASKKPRFTGPMVPDVQRDLLIGLPLINGGAARLGVNEGRHLAESAAKLRQSFAKATKHVFSFAADELPSANHIMRIFAGPKLRSAAVTAPDAETDKPNFVAKAMLQNTTFSMLGWNLHVRHFSTFDVSELRRHYRPTPMTNADIRACMYRLRIENEPGREYLVELLAATPGVIAANALAQIAVTDLSPKVRALARLALKKRPSEEYRNTLVRYLNYPWPPAAQHASRALVEMKLIEAVPEMIQLLKEPDVTLPRMAVVQGESRQVVPLLVRINHLRNCLICHAPRLNRTATTWQALKKPSGEKKKISFPVGTPPRYDHIVLPSWSAIGAYQSDLYVRGDITYLRPDFSVMQPVKNHGVWPAQQRFGFVVRMLPVTNEQAVVLQQLYAENGISRERQILIDTLRRLTSQNHGNRYEDWQPLLAQIR